jgi:hypothetical protein
MASKLDRRVVLRAVEGVAGVVLGGGLLAGAVLASWGWVSGAVGVLMLLAAALMLLKLQRERQ